MDKYLNVISYESKNIYIYIFPDSEIGMTKYDSLYIYTCIYIMYIQTHTYNEN